MRFLAALLVIASCQRPPATPPPNVTEVARGLEVPWSIVWVPDGRMLVAERPGRIRVIVNGQLQPEPLHTFENVSSRAEEGLMGLALHPQWSRARWLYASYATNRGGRMVVDVVRCELGTTLTGCVQLIRDIPAARFHAGCRLKFGPDGKLYVTTGDATDRELAQKMDSLAGKILRVNEDGTPPINNPFRGSLIYTLGHRNPQGIDWDPVSGLLFSTEHGPSGFDGPGGGDEVNIIERGLNYGWPLVHHRESREGMVSPLLEFTPACAPASGAFWRGDFYFGCLRGEHLHRVVLDPQDRRKVVSQEKLFTNLGRIREVAVGPDGALYFSTSNRDGRGDAAETDDRIFRVAP